MLLRRPQVPARVDRPELRILGYAAVEVTHQPAERLLAADGRVETWPCVRRCRALTGLTGALIRASGAFTRLSMRTVIHR